MQMMVILDGLRNRFAINGSTSSSWTEPKKEEIGRDEGSKFRLTQRTMLCTNA